MKNQLKHEVSKLHTFLSSYKQSGSSDDVIEHILNGQNGIVMMNELKRLNEELEITNKHYRIKSSNNLIEFFESSIQIFIILAGWVFIIQMDLFNSIYREITNQCNFKQTAHPIALINQDNVTNSANGCQLYLNALKQGDVTVPTTGDYFVLICMTLLLIVCSRFVSKKIILRFKRLN